MSERGKLIRRLHDKGLTYQEIGEIFGLSKQRVHEIASTNSGDSFHEEAVRKIKYVGLRNWMLANRVKVTELEKGCGGRMHNSLSGKYEPSKKNIDAILAFTGLTYEECFREEVEIEIEDGEDI